MCNRRDIRQTGMGLIAMKWDEMNAFGMYGKGKCMLVVCF